MKYHSIYRKREVLHDNVRIRHAESVRYVRLEAENVSVYKSGIPWNEKKFPATDQNIL